MCLLTFDLKEEKIEPTQHSTTQHNTAQHNATQHNTTQPITVHKTSKLTCNWITDVKFKDFSSRVEFVIFPIL